MTTADTVGDLGRENPVDITPKLTEAEIKAFVGQNADYYSSRWTPLLEGKDWSGFNWAACFLSGLWLSYRKMYKAAFIFYGAVFLVTMLEEVADAPDTSRL